MSPSVLHCYEDYKWTGASQPLADLCSQLNKEGWHSTLACPETPDPHKRNLADEARKKGINVHSGFYFNSSPNIRYNARDIRTLADLIAEKDFDIIHVHGSWDHMIAFHAIRRSPSRAPLIRTDHRGREYKKYAFHRLQFNSLATDHLIVLSNRLKQLAIDRMNRHPETISTVRGAVDTDEFRPLSPPPGIRAKFGLHESDVIVGIVARVQPHRRFGVLLKAAKQLKEQNSHIKIAVLGRGTRKEKLLDRPVVRMHLEDTVYPLGYRKDDYKEVLAMCDAGMLLVPGSDGSCRAAMQMAAMAKPLVVANRGVLPEIVLNGQTGIVVNDTPENLAAALLKMGSSAEQRRVWGQAARNRMKEFFSLERQTRDIIDIYKRLVRQKDT